MNKFIKINSYLIIFLLFFFKKLLLSGLPVYLDTVKDFKERAKDLVSRLTLEEKISQLGNNSPAIERLGIPAFKWWNECVHGVMAEDVTVFPHAILMASTWNPELIEEVATSISDEARALFNQGQKGLSYWSPVVNIARDPRWGRTQETYGEDPLLVSKMAVAFIKGLQGNHPKYLKTIATAKHFVANNEETRRHTGSSNIDEKIFNEYYLPHFKKCVTDAKVQSVMCAYNAFNSIPCCANKYLIEDILRNDWGFDGYVVSDCGAIWDIYSGHHYVNSIEEAVAVSLKSGCDLDCGSYYQDYLLSALQAGLITEKDIDRAVTRLFEARMKLGLFDSPEVVPYSKIGAEVINSPENKKLALETAREGIVLLKNENNFLPLLRKKMKKIAVMGPYADKCLLGNYSGKPKYCVNVFEGVKNIAGREVEVVYLKGCESEKTKVISGKYLKYQGEDGLLGEYFDNRYLEGKPIFKRIDKEINFRWPDSSPDKRIPEDNFSIRWKGKLIPEISKDTTILVTADDGIRFYLNGKLLIDKWIDRPTSTDEVTVNLSGGTEYDIVIEYYESSSNAEIKLEGDLFPPRNFEDDFITASKCDAIIVTAGTDETIEGEEKDRTTLDLPLYQKEMIRKIISVNRNVILVLLNGGPLNISEEKEKIPAIIEMWYAGQEGGTAVAEIIFGDVNPSGKLPVTFYSSEKDLPPMDDYDITKGRTYMYYRKKPLFPFGHGLSYTEFLYENLRVFPEKVTTQDKIEVIVSIKNTGNMEGKEIVQVYSKRVEDISGPSKKLIDFRKISLKPGERKEIRFFLDISSFSEYDISKKKFIIKNGSYEIMVGKSSSDICLRKNIIITGN